MYDPSYRLSTREKLARNVKSVFTASYNKRFCKSEIFSTIRQIFVQFTFDWLEPLVKVRLDPFTVRYEAKREKKAAILWPITAETCLLHICPCGRLSCSYQYLRRVYMPIHGILIRFTSRPTSSATHLCFTYLHRFS